MLQESFFGSAPDGARTIVSVQSVSLGGLTSRYLRGLNHFEERNFYQLDLLRGNGSCIMVLSDDVDQDFMGYAIRHASRACALAPGEVHRRLKVVKVATDGRTSLTRLLLESPGAFASIQLALAGTRQPALDFWNVSEDEVSLAKALGLPHYGLPKQLLDADSKSNGRAIFEAQGIPLPAGRRDIFGLREARTALKSLAAETGAESFLIKLNREEAGNGIARVQRSAIDGPQDRFVSALEVSKKIPVDAFLQQLAMQGCVVEEFIEAPAIAFPSVKMNILPDGQVINLATHDQILSGMAYAGSRFPAASGYRAELIAFGHRIAAHMSASGVRGIVSADFIATRNHARDRWTLRALEINARKGATTHPYCWTRLLTSGTYDAGTGLMRSATGDITYRSSEYIESPGLSRVSPRELIAALEDEGLDFDPARQSGVLIHMATSLRDFSKFGATFIGHSSQEVDRLHAEVVQLARRLGSRSQARQPLVPLRS